MKKINMKMKQYSILTLLVVISIVLVGLIYSTGQKKDEHQLVGTENQADDLMVDEIDYVVDEPKDSTKDSEDQSPFIKVENIFVDDQYVSPEVNVESINIEEDSNTEISLVDIEEVDVPISEEPEKPNLTPPEVVPETKDDLTDPDKVPEYDEEETTYTPEPEAEEVADEVRGTNLVPDSENPFLQDDIPSNGNMGEMMGKDYDEGAPSGEGDKF
ncbi:conserved protein of unknown function [Petrocella atlantisensis]|uniref:Uncharacterized protein n=1 Tax=Petrocella atlantisensis TaxID=2173034 RepID=A0A3P7PTC4_9FIRM|nr:hypothetical protein [Petrocella atlantisensis]VDN47287.1 conserved protein of unknown function [Petrocella atlantisensis]